MFYVVMDVTLTKNSVTLLQFQEIDFGLLQKYIKRKKDRNYD